jgi:hypothetical protein
MHDKTLLYGTLAATAVATAFGIWRDQARPIAITPVSIVDAPAGLREAAVPIQLTASDGTGLKLVDMKVRAALEDPLALTEMHLTFENPAARQLEGTFRITLPQGASLSRFAMKVGSQWQEGEVVEKQAARRAYEDFLHRKQDPALLEQGAGNEFTARVFPIPARGKKEIIITYSEVLDASKPYTVSLRGLPQLGTLDVDVHARAASETSFGLHKRSFTPAQDFVVDARAIPRSAGLRNGDIVMARLRPFADSRPDPLSNVVVMVDTSASRGLGLKEQANLVRDVLAKVPAKTKVTVACFDQAVEEIFTGAAGEFGAKELEAIVKRGALGASNLESAIAWTAERAKATGADRVVFVSDGVPTAGELDGQKLKTKVEALRPAGVKRLDAMAIGGIRDDGILRALARGVLDKDGAVLDAEIGADRIVRRLGEATASGLAVKVAGAAWSWPRTVDGVQAGDEIVVFAQTDGATRPTFTVGELSVTPELRVVDRPLLERAWAQAKIQSLIEEPTNDAVSTKRDIIALSTQHRVLSPHTAMLVLETDFDYRRFNIDRTANLDILTVQNGRAITAKSTRQWQYAQAEDDDKEKKEDEGSMGRRNERAKRRFGVRGPSGGAEPATATPTASAAAPTPALEEAPADVPSSADNAVNGHGSAAPGRADRQARGGDLGAGSGGGGVADGFAQGLGGATGATAAEPPPPPMADPAPASPSTAPAATATLAAPQQQAVPRVPVSPPAARPRPAMRPPVVRRPPPTQERDGDPSSTAQLGLFDGTRTAPQGTVRQSSLTVDGDVSRASAQAAIRGKLSAFRACYTSQLVAHSGLGGEARIRVQVGPDGAAQSVVEERPLSGATSSCILATARQMRFAAGKGGTATFVLDFVPPPSTGTGPADGVARAKALPYEGRFKTVMQRLSSGDKDGALAEARAWQSTTPGDVLALVALGEAHEARGELKDAARAYGSILELYSFRADSRRFAGERLERLADPLALGLAADTFAKAEEQRPDHPASHRLLGYALLKQGLHEKAFTAIATGAARSYPSGRFAGVDRILKEDLGIVAAAWKHAEPERAAEINALLAQKGGTPENGPSLRFVLNWETDANDVDFHIYDGKGGHAYYGARELPSGGSLYADVTTGYGPECFTIRGPRASRAYPYTLQAHYYSRGPMGYGMGKLQVIDHDGKGNVTFEERPFVVMVDKAYVDMGVVEKPKPELLSKAK